VFIPFRINQTSFICDFNSVSITIGADDDSSSGGALFNLTVGVSIKRDYFQSSDTAAFIAVSSDLFLENLSYTPCTKTIIAPTNKCIVKI